MHFEVYSGEYKILCRDKILTQTTLSVLMWLKVKLLIGSKKYMHIK